jgi:uncharacterized protein (DUF2384 family)
MKKTLWFWNQQAGPWTCWGVWWRQQIFIGISRIAATENWEISDRDKTIARAIEVLGSRAEALRWLSSPVRALDSATPFSMLGTPEGVERVNNVLGQIEHGVF